MCFIVTKQRLLGEVSHDNNFLDLGKFFLILDLGEPLSFKHSLALRSSRKAGEGENDLLEYDYLAVMTNRMSDFQMTRPHVMIIWNKRLLFTMEDIPQFGRSVCFNSTIVFS